MTENVHTGEIVQSDIDTNLSNIEIRQATRADFDAALAIVHEYSDAINVTVRETERTFEQYFEPRAGIWLAKCADEIIGCIALRPLELADQAEIKRLYVKAEWRGKNIAAKLLEAAHNFARINHYQWCYLDSKADLVAAIKFYERSGYEHCERYNDNPQAVIFMRKALEVKN